MKIGDILIIVLLTVFIVFLTYRFYFQNSGSQGAVVAVDGKTVHSFSKNELAGEGIYTFEMKKGFAEIEINQGKIRVLPMPRELCPRGICSKMGWIKRAGTSIICLPNRLVVQIYGKEQIKLIDAVAR